VPDDVEAPADAVPNGDPVITPATDQSTDDDGNTVVVGYPPGVSEGYSGMPGTDVGSDGGYEEPVGA
jgi:hypothetical protein